MIMVSYLPTSDADRQVIVSDPLLVILGDPLGVTTGDPHQVIICEPSKITIEINEDHNEETALTRPSRKPFFLGRKNALP